MRGAGRRRSTCRRRRRGPRARGSCRGTQAARSAWTAGRPRPRSPSSPPSGKTPTRPPRSVTSSTRCWCFTTSPRLPRRALNPPADHQPSQVDLATLRLRQRVRKGPRSRAAGTTMAFKLLESAEDRWRAVNAPHLVALVRAAPPSREASSSNDPTNQEVTPTPRDTPIHRSRLFLRPPGDFDCGTGGQ